MYKRIIKLLLCISMCVVYLPTLVHGETITGVPYDESGNYDVTKSHVIINQIYGGSSKTYSNYSFIELYNPTSEDVDLSSWSLQYISSQEGGNSAFAKLDLTGTIKSHCSYLIRCNALSSPQSNAISIDSYDQSWDITIYTKGCSVVLVDHQNLITSEVYDLANKKPLIEGYVDMLSVSGNDETEEQKAIYYESNVSATQSKKKGIRRVNFQDTDDNAADTMIADYSFESSEYINYIKPRSSADGSWSASNMPTYTVTYNSNGGSTVASQSYAYYTAVTMPANPTMSGYTFDGWYTDSTLTAAYDFSVLPTESFTLYAKWSLEAKSSSQLNALKATVPAYLDVYYTAESAKAVNNVLAKINASSSLTSTQITQYYQELSEALEGLTYKTNDVPQVYISTVNQNGLSIVKADGYVYTDIVIVDTDGSITKEEDAAQIKVRGNSTALGEKKPYLLKFSSKQDVLGMGKAKKWILNPNLYDPTLLRNYTALELAQYLGLEGTTDYKVVEVYVDGSFRGCYLIQEKIEEGSNRVDIDTSNNEFLLEFDTVFTDSDTTYLSFGDDIRFGICEPDEPTESQVSYIQTKMTSILNVIKAGNYSEIQKVIDVDSFAKYWLVNSFMKTRDFALASVYFYYKDGKLYAGPVWDFDISSGNTNSNFMDSTETSADYVRENCNLYKYLLKCSQFKQLAKQYYVNQRSHLLWIANTHIDELYAKYKGAIDRNYSDAGWSVSKAYIINERKPDSTYQANLSYYKQWLNDRIDGLDSYYGVSSTGSYTTNYNPTGCVDSIVVGSGNIYVGGWAFDKDSASTSIKVKVYVGSTCIGTLTANQSRDDVNNVYGITGRHGFSGTLLNSLTGTQTVTIKAVNLGSGVEYTIGSKSVTISATNTDCYSTTGCVDAITVSAGKIYVAGWVFDMDSPSTSINVKVYAGATYIGTLTANQARDDINTIYGTTGNHGFSGTFKTTLTGDYTIIVKGVNVGSGVENMIGSKKVTLLPSDVNNAPIGNVEAVTASAGSVKIAGWAFDEDSSSKSISVKAYIGSTCLGTLTANIIRDDVNAAYNITGSHGFSGTLSTTLTGAQTVTIKALDASSGSEYTIGHKTITIPSSYATKYSPKGNVEAVTATDGSIKIAGWAYDPDDASQSISVKAYVGTTCLGTLSANIARADVNSAFSISGKHGFSGKLSTTLSGKQTVTIKAVDLGSGVEYTIGSKSVTISSSYTTKYNPVANIEAVTQTDGNIKVYGWAYDPDAPKLSINIKVYIGTTCLGTLIANQTRDDVNTACNITGKHGFYGTFNTTLTGTQTVTIKAVNVGSGVEYTIGSRSITIPSYYSIKYNPIGNVEAITATSNSITIAGWAYDPDDANQSISVKAYIGSTCLGTVKTNIARSDVNSKFSISGNHGFGGKLSTTLSGKQTVTIKAVDVGSGAEYTIGSKAVTISSSYTTKYNPKGNVEAITATAGGIKIAGWAYDPDNASQSISVKAYVGSTCLGTLSANIARADVNSAFSISGNHGFSGILSTTLTGTQTVTIKAVNVGSGVEYTIGSKVVNIPSSSITTYTTKYAPQGSADVIQAQGSGQVYAGGWAFDKDSPGTNVAIKMYAGSTLIGTGTTSFTRSDVNTAYGITGTHGYNLTCTTALRGTYTITIKAVDLQTNTEYTIGSKSITIS